MTTSVPLYSAAVAEAAVAKNLVLVAEWSPTMGDTVTVHPGEQPNIISGSAWQPEPGGPWRAGQSFGAMPVEFDNADDAILHAMGGGPLTKRLGYVLMQPKKRR